MLKIKKLSFYIAPIFGIYNNFLNLLFLNKFITVSLALLSLLTTLLSSALNVFEVESDDLVIFNKKVSNTAILLKF